MTSPVWVVLSREYLERVRTRAFLITTLAVPVFAVGLILVPAYMAGRQEAGNRRVSIVDRTGVLAGPVALQLEAAGFQVDVTQATDTSLAILESRVASGDIGGYLVLDETSLSQGRASYRAVRPPGALGRLGIRQAVVQAALEARLGGGRDEGVRTLLEGGDLTVDVVGSSGPESGVDRAYSLGYGGAFLLYIVLLMYGVAVMRSVLEEKTNRIVEIVVSCIEPWELMLGKVLGVGAVGLTQIGIWIVIMGAAMIYGLPLVLAAQPGLVDGPALRAILPDATLSFLFLAFFVFGYFLYAALYATVGAICSSEEELQQAQLPVTLLLIVPILFLSFALEQPDTALSSGLSLVPFFSPTLMFSRAALGQAPAWQIALSFVLMAAMLVVLAWVAGRIYRVGILMQGKRPTLPELLRWLRAS